MRYLPASLVALSAVLILALSSCNDDDGDGYNNSPSPDGNANTLRISFGHEVNGDSLVFDEMRYENKAGQRYGVTKLEYIVTDFRLYTDATSYEEISTSQYVNPEKTGSTSFTLNELPDGDYEQVSFVFGIREEKNRSGNLPSSRNIANMGWPPGNGGGYHYMRMNGNYESDSAQGVFTTHLGHTKQWALDTTVNGVQDTAVVTDETVKSFAFEVKLPGSAVELSNGSNASMTITMDLNNWYQNPNTYRFPPSEKAGIMQRQSRQQTLKENGMRDVFQLTNLSS